MIITIKDSFFNDFKTREAGEKLRQMILIHLKTEDVIELDFSQIEIASISFIDEFLVKLFTVEKIRPKDWSKLKIVNMNTFDKKLALKMLQDSKTKVSF